MPRIDALIDKLKQQHQANVPAVQMMATLQMIQKEIAGGLKETEVLGTSGVSVMIPNAPSANYPKSIEVFGDDSRVYFNLPETEASDEEITELLLQQSQAKKNDTPPPGTKQSKQGKVKKEETQPELAFGDEQFDGLADVPTFARHIKTGRKEEGPGEHHNRQLKNAINEEDRLVFLSELFRDDKDMYERSIKTIDNFDTYAEAEFWIRRELKVKVGWLPNNATAAKFDLLVKSRFS